MCVRACVHACVRACVCVCVCACVCVCVCVFLTQTGAFDHSTFDVEFKCTYFVSELVEFRIEEGGQIVLTQCAHAHACLVCLMLFCCTCVYACSTISCNPVNTKVLHNYRRLSKASAQN